MPVSRAIWDYGEKIKRIKALQLLKKAVHQTESSANPRMKLQ